MAQPGDRLTRLVAAFVAGRESAHTRRLDLTTWLDWCQRAGIDPLDAWPAHTQLWLGDVGHRGEAGTTQARRLGAVSSW